jgi:GNAT superfamily N-acetyltransferase
MNSNMEIRPLGLTTEELQQTAFLLKHVFGKSHFTANYLKWQYLDNPRGRAIGYNAFFGAEQVAHYTVQPAIFLFNGKEVKGALSLNTVTHPDHQGKGLFRYLADATYNAAREAGARFIIGVANKNSTHGFVNKLGFSLLGPLEAKIGMGLPKETSMNAEFKRSYSEDDLKWRLSAPGNRYYRSKGFLFSPSGMPFLHAVIGKAKSNVNVEEKSFLPLFKLHIGLDCEFSFSGFPIPEKLKPSPLNLIYKDLTGSDTMPEVGKIKFNLLDFDAY